MQKNEGFKWWWARFQRPLKFGLNFGDHDMKMAFDAGYDMCDGYHRIIKSTKKTKRVKRCRI